MKRVFDDSANGHMVKLREKANSQLQAKPGHVLIETQATRWPVRSNLEFQMLLMSSKMAGLPAGMADSSDLSSKMAGLPAGMTDFWPDLSS